MAYKGKFRPSNTKKYRGNPSNIIYRSLWERKFMVYCDLNENILEWGSEEIVIPYRSPLDSRVHHVQRYIIEIKPKRQCKEPKVQKEKTKKYIYEVTEYAKNQAKWKAAEDYCEDRKWQFKVLTEDDLGI